jgi:hypothetical protein
MGDRMMKGILSIVAAAACLSVGSVSELAAQPWSAGLPGDDVASLAVQLGIRTQVTLPDDASFGSSAGAGIAATFWPRTHVGFRGSFLATKISGDEGPNGAKAGREDATLMMYGLELMLRRSVGASGRYAYSPYLGLGGGGKTYQWTEWLTGHQYDFTYSWGFSAGVEIRPTASPWYGLQLEMKRHSSQYKWHGFHIEEPVISDMFFTAGISIHR